MRGFTVNFGRKSTIFITLYQNIKKSHGVVIFFFNCKLNAGVDTVDMLVELFNVVLFIKPKSQLQSFAFGKVNIIWFCRNLYGDTEDVETSTSQDSSAPKSLNSDISWFGVGGKQAIFFIGSATRVSVLFTWCCSPLIFDCLENCVDRLV